MNISPSSFLRFSNVYFSFQIFMLCLFTIYTQTHTHTHIERKREREQVFFFCHLFIFCRLNLWSPYFFLLTHPVIYFPLFVSSPFSILFMISDSLCLLKFSLISDISLHVHCPADWGRRIHWLHLCRGVRLLPHTPNKSPGYEAKQSDGEVLVKLELWWMQSTPSLPLLPGPL